MPSDAAVQQSLRDAGLPADNLTSRLRDLPAPARELHRRILTHLAERGRPPANRQLQEWADHLSVNLPDALSTLAARELIFADPAAGRVHGGVPFAAHPTAHRVRIAAGPEVPANCALDALGIPAMLGRDADITSTDPTTGTPVTASVRAGRWSWEPAEAAVFVGTSGPGQLTEACCPVINFYASPQAARAHQDALGLTGTVLTLPDAARAGGLVFGNARPRRRAGPNLASPGQTASAGTPRRGLSRPPVAGQQGHR